MSSDGVLIRSFKMMRDIRACRDVAISCWNHKVADTVMDQIGEGIYFVAEIDGVVAGFTGARRSYLAPNAWEIPWIAVTPDHQDKHIGFKLLYNLRNELERRYATLIVTVTEKQEFFKKLGFESSEQLGDSWALMTLQLRAVGF